MRAEIVGRKPHTSMSLKYPALDWLRLYGPKRSTKKVLSTDVRAHRTYSER